ncbi:MAG: RNA polymerase subunit sigma-70 [Rhodobacterales bacterium]|nr:RNA polymerase subunit sigma-70 [Rhodobacterales bacterium]
MGTPSAAEVAERAARLSYGRLLAILAAGTRDLPLAEEALAVAFARALEVWPRQGVPANPEGWLLTVARNGLSNLYRHDRTRAAATEELILRAEERADRAVQADERLSLMFVCAHPAIDPAARTPLMLQAVLGLDAARIATAFLVPAATMGQRLVRAKARIRELRLRFALPEAEDLPDRLADMLEAIYGAFGADWDGSQALGLPEEAIHLARVLLALIPEEPEVKGLLALMLYIHARRAARDGAVFVPLSEQDATLWDRDQVIEAEELLTLASRAGRFGRFQCEAAIQSVHVQRAITGKLNLEALETLHGLLTQFHPTVGGQVAHAAVRRLQGEPQEALAMLDQLPDAVRIGYQPALVLRAHCLRDLGRTEAPEAARAAILATQDDRVAAYLVQEFGRPLRK